MSTDSSFRGGSSSSLFPSSGGDNSCGSSFHPRFWWWIAVVIAVFVIGFFAFPKGPDGPLYHDRATLPILIRKYDISPTAIHTFSTEIASVPPDSCLDIEYLLNNFSRIVEIDMSTGKPFQSHFYLYRKDGVLLKVDSSGKVYLPNTFGVLWVFRDWNNPSVLIRNPKDPRTYRTVRHCPFWQELARLMMGWDWESGVVFCIESQIGFSVGFFLERFFVYGLEKVSEKHTSALVLISHVYSAVFYFVGKLMLVTNGQFVNMLVDAKLDSNEVVRFFQLSLALRKKHGRLLFVQEVLDRVKLESGYLYAFLVLLKRYKKDAVKTIKSLLVLYKQRAAEYDKSFTVVSSQDSHEELLAKFLEKSFGKVEVHHKDSKDMQFSVVGEGRYYKRDLDLDIKKLLGV